MAGVAPVAAVAVAPWPENVKEREGTGDQYQETQQVKVMTEEWSVMTWVSLESGNRSPEIFLRRWSLVDQAPLDLLCHKQEVRVRRISESTVNRMEGVSGSGVRLPRRKTEMMTT